MVNFNFAIYILGRMSKTNRGLAVLNKEGKEGIVINKPRVMYSKVTSCA